MPLFCTHTNPSCDGVRQTKDCSGKQASGAGYFYLEQGRSVAIRRQKTTLFFLISGNGILLAGQSGSSGAEVIRIQAQTIMLFAPERALQIVAGEDMKGILLGINDPVRLCRTTQPDALSGMDAAKNSGGFASLPLHSKMMPFLHSLAPFLLDDEAHASYIDLKTQEFVLLLNLCYPEGTLQKLFAPVLNADFGFASFIWDNYRKVRTATEFAELTHCSLSAFKQKFRNVFGVPVLKWINEQKQRDINYDLTCTNKSLKQIAEEYHFASVSYLSTFCRKNMARTPSEIRNHKQTG